MKVPRNIRKNLIIPNMAGRRSLLYARKDFGNCQDGTSCALPCDGWRYRGRGLIQLTGKDAYSRAADATGLPLVSDPDLAATPEAAAEVACWTWAVWKDCNPLADAGDIERWRKAINGGLNGLQDVKARYAQALRVAG